MPCYKYDLSTYEDAYYDICAGADGLVWALQIDWDGDGEFNGSNDAMKMSSLFVRRGRENLINSSSTGFEDVQPGEFEAVIDNNDGEYDPDNTSSSLYPNVAPGKKFNLRVTNDATGNICNLITGKIKKARVD